MRLSVIIATKDRARFLERALASLCEQVAAPRFEAIIVDNGSTDETPETVRRAAAQAPFPVRYLREPEPNRGLARNRGIDVAEGHLIVFCDDDVELPPGWLLAHDRAHEWENLVVNGPILNVPVYASAAKPTIANYSGAFFCTCNVSVPRRALQAAGGFDAAFNLYGWEDTELGVRLREAGLRRRFAWDAFLWHIKPPSPSSLEAELQKAIEKARMAVRFIAKRPTARVRSATGAHPMNLARARALEPLLPWLAGIATEPSLPGGVRAAARAQLLDAVYTVELARELRTRV